MNTLPESLPIHYTLPAHAIGAFVSGCIFGAVIGAPVALTGAALAVSGVANHAINVAVRHLGQKYNWNISKAALLKTFASALVNTVAIAALFGLGIVGSTGATILGGLLLLSLSAGFVYAESAKREELSPESPQIFIKQAVAYFA